MNARERVVEAARSFAASGLTIATWGNISLREGELVYITPSGMDYASLAPEDIVEVEWSGRAAGGGVRTLGKRRPSTELKLHLAVYAAREDAGAIVHTHAVESTAFAVTGRTVPVITDEAAQVLRGEVRTAEYALPGTEELAAGCVAALGSVSAACLLRAHGAVCLGGDLDRALLCARVLEQTCEIYRLALSLGGPAEPFPQERIESMTAFLQKSYGQKQY